MREQKKGKLVFCPSCNSTVGQFIHDTLPTVCVTPENLETYIRPVTMSLNSGTCVRCQQKRCASNWLKDGKVWVDGCWWGNEKEQFGEIPYGEQRQGLYMDGMPYEEYVRKVRKEYKSECGQHNHDADNSSEIPVYAAKFTSKQAHIPCMACYTGTQYVPINSDGYIERHSLLVCDECRCLFFKGDSSIRANGNGGTLSDEVDGDGHNITYKADSFRDLRTSYSKAMIAKRKIKSGEAVTADNAEELPAYAKRYEPNSYAKLPCMKCDVSMTRRVYDNGYVCKNGSLVCCKCSYGYKDFTGPVADGKGGILGEETPLEHQVLRHESYRGGGRQTVYLDGEDGINHVTPEWNRWVCDMARERNRLLKCVRQHALTGSQVAKHFLKELGLEEK